MAHPRLAPGRQLFLRRAPGAARQPGRGFGRAPLAVAAGQAALFAGGSAADAAIAAQAVLCVLCPDACGLGGDMFALVADRAQTVAINGAGMTPQDATTFADDGPHSVTVPAWPAAGPSCIAAGGACPPPPCSPRPFAWRRMAIAFRPRWPRR
jgi:hypothetical protein